MSNIATSPIASATNAATAAANDAVQQPANVTPIADIKANVTEAEGMELQKQRHNAAYERITKLRDERQTWNDTVYKTSNDMLYGVLQQCYAMYFDMCGKSTEAAALREALAKHIEERKIKTLPSTHTMTKIVRCVFDGDRKRFNTYSRVLQAALAQNKAVNELAQFIVDNGGVDEIYRAKSATALSTADKASYAATALRDRTLATVEEPAITQLLDGAKDGVLHVAIVTQRAGGAIEVNAIVSSEGVLKAALAAYYSAHKEQITATTANATTASKQDKHDVALEELAKLAA